MPNVDILAPAVGTRITSGSKNLISVFDGCFATIGIASTFALTGNAKIITIIDPAILENDLNLHLGSHIPSNRRIIPDAGITEI